MEFVNSLRRGARPAMSAPSTRSRKTDVGVAVAQCETVALRRGVSTPPSRPPRERRRGRGAALAASSAGFENVTRYTHPGADASVAVVSLRDGVVGAATRPARAIRLDLLDTYRIARRTEALEDSSASARAGWRPAPPSRRLPPGYWRIIASGVRAQRGKVAAAAPTARSRGSRHRGRRQRREAGVY